MDNQRDQIEEIKNRLDVVDVVGKYVQLKQAGKNFSGICPFHSEKTPSFIVSPELQRYKCFGCGETGDIFNFVQKIENIDFPETLEKLAKEAGVTLIKKKVNTTYERLEEINNIATIYFYKELNHPSNKEALEYVQQRGFSKETIKTFGIGYAPGGNGLLEYIQKKKKYSKIELLNSGLFTEKEGRLKGKFFKRIMFPIRSSAGKVIAFTGRILPSVDFGPKYMNSPETPIYHKKDNFYAQYESRQEIRRLDLVIVCEGSTDVISAHQAGVKNIVAPLGTALTKEQLQKISKYTKNVIFLFDSDTAGQTALQRAFLLAQEVGLNTFAANTLPYKDLDELIKNDPKKLQSIVKTRTDTFTYLLAEFLKDKNLNKLEDYQKTVTWVRKMLSTITDKGLYNFYAEKTFRMTKIDIKGVSQKHTNTPAIPRDIPINKLEHNREKIYLQTLLFNPDIKIPKDHNIEYFKDDQVRKILTYIKEGKSVTREDLLTYFQDEKDIYQIIEDAIFNFSKSDTNSEDLNGIFRNISKDYFVRKEHEINVKIAVAEETGNSKESERLLLEFQNLTKEKHKHEQNS